MSSGGNPTTTREIPHIGKIRRKKKKTHTETQERLSHDLIINSTPNTVTDNLEASQKSKLLPEDQSIWIQHQVLQLLSPGPERWSPKISRCESQEARLNENDSYDKLSSSGFDRLTWLPHKPRTEAAVWKGPSFWERGQFAFKASVQGTSIQFNTYLEAYWNTI